MSYKKHDQNCDTCKLFKSVWNKHEVYFLCNGNKLKLESVGFPITTWIMKRGCDSWIEREPDWYLKEVKVMEDIIETEKHCNNCKFFEIGEDEYGFFEKCKGEMFPYRASLEVIDWISTHGCCSFEPSE
jgi:hypothetical protein